MMLNPDDSLFEFFIAVSRCVCFATCICLCVLFPLPARFVESEAWKHYNETGKMRWREFATREPEGVQRGMSACRWHAHVQALNHPHPACVPHPCLKSAASPLPANAAAPKYASMWEQLADIGNTLLGTLGLSEAVTDNASVNVVPLQVGAQAGSSSRSKTALPSSYGSTVLGTSCSLQACI